MTEQTALFDTDVAIEPVVFTCEGMPQSAGSKRSFPWMKDTRALSKLIAGDLIKNRPRSSDVIASIIEARLKSDANLGVRVTDDNPKLKKWQRHVERSAQRAMDGRPLITGPVRATFVFYVPRPLNHFGTGKNADKLKASARRHPEVKPDALKLARGVEDALTDVVYVDDAQIVTETILKRYGEPARVEVRIERETD